MLFPLSFCILVSAHLANASLSPTFPVKGSVCQVAKDCQIKWTDTPTAPSASSMGETTIDLVTGDPKSLQVAQRLGGVSNPSVAQALTFQPDVSLSPTTQYAIRFIPKGNPANPIFSTFFTITGGNGTAKTVPASVVDASNATALGVPSGSNNSTAAGANATTSTHVSTTGGNTSSAAAGAASDKPSAAPARFTHSSSLALLVLTVVALLL